MTREIRQLLLQLRRGCDQLDEELGSQTVTRHIRGVLLQGGQGSSATSAVLTVMAVRAGVGAHPASSATLRPTAAVRDAVAVGVSAQEVLARVQRRSGLTIEEIASVLGTSRRTLHNWKNGAPINAVNELRLRELDHALGRIPVEDPRAMPNTLLERVGVGVRMLDLLAEGRFETAVSVATGTRMPAGGATEREGLEPALAARLDPLGHVEPVGRPAVLNRRLRRARV